MGVAAIAAGGCDWRTFDKEGDKAPVRSIGAPGGYVGKDFGRVLMPLRNGMGAPAAFVASGASSLSLLIIKVDARGGTSTSAAPESRLEAVDDSAVTGLAEFPTTGQTEAKLLLGAPDLRLEDFGQAFVYPVAEGEAVPVPAPTDVGSGRAVGVGPVTAPGAVDYVIASDGSLSVLAGGSAGPGALVTIPKGADACDPTFDQATLDTRYKGRRSFLMKSLWSEGLEGTMQVVLGSPHASSTLGGTISFYGVRVAGESVGCLGGAEMMTPEGAKIPLFGVSLASGDFNDDRVPDLLVGAPPRRAFVFLGPLPAGLATPIAIEDPAGVDFGFAVAALNVDGMPGDEAMIADPDARVNETEGAGHVQTWRYVAATNKMEREVSMTYADFTPGGGARYGYSVHALKFCTTPTGATEPVTSCADGDANAARVLMVGAGNEVFLYFTVGDKIPADRKDVRLP
jgi:hypothetical protein